MAELGIQRALTRDLELDLLAEAGARIEGFKGRCVCVCAERVRGTVHPVFVDGLFVGLGHVAGVVGVVAGFRFV